jgi:hypothetical protein
MQVARSAVKESDMYRVPAIVLGLMLLIASVSQAQSLADAARANRKQKAQDGSSASKVITSDDLTAPSQDLTIHLVPGATSNGDGTLVAPGRWKHGYSTTNLDATQFPNGGVLHIEITLGDGPAEASFDLYAQNARLPSDGFPNSLAGAHDVRSGSTATIDYHFDHPTTFRLGAEGSWNAKAGDRNNYRFTVYVKR